MTNSTIATKTINVLKDNEGDYMVTLDTAPQVGTVAFQLSGAAVDAEGGPLAALDSIPGFVLFNNANTLKDGAMGKVADIAARLEYTLVESVERPVSDKLVAALSQAA